MTSARPRIGVDLGGTKVLMVAEWEERRLVRRAPTGGGFGAADLAAALATFLGEVADPPRHVGIAVPGLVAGDGRVVACDTLPRLVGWRASESLSLGCPLHVMNDAEAALREESRDLAPGSTAGVVMIGTGIGAAFLVDGRPLRGARGWAGELGSIPLAGTGVVVTLDELASGAALLKRCGLSAEALLARAQAGDEGILATVRRAGRAMGLGLAVVVNLLNPSLLALGGGVLEYPSYLEAALEAARAHSLPELWRCCELRTVREGELVAALGALRDGETDL